MHPQVSAKCRDKAQGPRWSIQPYTRLSVAPAEFHNLNNDQKKEELPYLEPGTTPVKP